MDCLHEHYLSPYEDSDSDGETNEPKAKQICKEKQTQTTKKTNLQAEIEELKGSLIESNKERDGLEDRLAGSMEREKALKMQVKWLQQCLSIQKLYPKGYANKK